jgi:hypothetical protein
MDSEDLKPNFNNPLELAYNRSWRIQEISPLIKYELQGQTERAALLTELCSYGLKRDARTILTLDVSKINMDAPTCLLWIPDHK